MNQRRTALLIVLGAVGGSLLTTLLFLFFRGSGDSDAENDVSLALEDTQSKDVATDEDPPAFERDIKGDCVFFGRITSADGTPIAEASLSVWLLDQSWSSPQPEALGKTDVKGLFSLPGLDQSIPMLLYAAAPGYAVATIENPTCGAPMEMVVEKGADIAVTVSDEKGNSVENAEILIAGDNVWPPRIGHSDRKGRLRVEGVPPGDCAFWAMHGNRSGFTPEPVTVGAGQVSEVKLSLLPRPLTRLRVLDAVDQSAMEEVTVIISPKNAPLLQHVQLTGTDGGITVPCPDRDGCIFLAGESGFVDRIPVEVSMGGTRDLFLKEGGAITGFVVSRQGDPIEGAGILVDEKVGGNTVSLHRSEGKMFNRMLLGNAAVGWPHLSMLSRNACTLGPASLPVPRVMCPDCKKDRLDKYWTSTDENGVFRLDGLPQRPLSLSAVHAEMVMAAAPTLVDMTETAEASGVSIVMRQGSVATIRVVDERGIPITDASVVLYDRDGARLTEALSDNDGYVEFKGLPGYFRIEASREEYVAAVSKVDGRVGVNVDLQMKLDAADKTLVGRVNDKNGFGMSGVAVVARAVDKGHLHVVTGVTDANGGFVLEGVGQGSYSISADGGEKGRAIVSSATFDEEVKLVLGSGAGPAVPLGDDETLIEPDPGWSTDNLSPAPHASGPSSAGFDLDGEPSGDNLGVMSSAGAAISGDDETDAPTVSVSTEFGEADALPVTGPPSGKGGLPIKLSGANGKVVVAGVVPGSRVETAGLMKGSQIVSIDGMPVSGLQDAKRALSGTIGSVVMMEVLEPGNPDPFTIVVQRVRVK